ncbi:heterocyst development glycosyltransferase HepC [Anabaena sp. UHCC 0451]|uniref:heterocyst development glycosyltransferase HepC n=1 Tax=Anabaena sp. UHCC 0451 TaxID=2055235 RepID=UPI002B21A756|nr:heterocyst development glycosyltransferase HepC [Anabaena sp. UHCC 0451]MEA5575262.1 heterocyst development glycosyltransferase HepC [Anabaena sp. UHCC 0451]
MTTSILTSLQEAHNTTVQQPQNYHSQYCTLQWRRNQLLVKAPKNLQQLYLPSLKNEQLLIDCLKHSPISLVTIDPQLGEATLQFWGNACKQAHKPIFLRLPFRHKLPKPSHQIFRTIQRVSDWILALILLFFVSPLMLGLIIMMQFQSPQSLFAYEWHISEKGKLFPAFKFCTTRKNKITSLGLWMRKYRLDNLPRLLNILRGEMSLFGDNSWSLKDAVNLSLGVTKEELDEQPQKIKTDESMALKTEFKSVTLS